MGFIIWIIGLVAAAIGILLANFLLSIVTFSATELISALVWFLISFTVYYAGKKIDNESWFKLLSLNFFLTWAFCTIGVLVGEVIWTLIDNESATINLNTMATLFFGALPLTIGPTAAMSLGLRD